MSGTAKHLGVISSRTSSDRGPTGKVVRGAACSGRAVDMHSTTAQRGTPALRLSLRPREAAEALGISPSTLERLTRAGEIPARKANRCTVYSVAALQAWAEGREIGGCDAAS
jgi:excisionase family DNA binding protein